MTPRCYWDAFDNMWERRPAPLDGCELAYLVWSPTGPIVGPSAYGRWDVIAQRLGPMVPVA